MIKIIQVWILNPSHLISIMSTLLSVWRKRMMPGCIKFQQSRLSLDLRGLMICVKREPVDALVGRRIDGGLATSKMIGEVISAPVEKIFVE